jgi:phosphocarrier protein HPr
VISKKIKIINRLGLHARAAACFVKLASSFNSDIFLVYGQQHVNGKSIMGIMMLAAPHGTDIVLEISGEDETEALEILVNLISNRFGEDE